MGKYNRLTQCACLIEGKKLHYTSIIQDLTRRKEMKRYSYLKSIVLNNFFFMVCSYINKIIFFLIRRSLLFKVWFEKLMVAMCSFKCFTEIRIFTWSPTRNGHNTCEKFHRHHFLLRLHFSSHTKYINYIRCSNLIKKTKMYFHSFNK